MVSTGYGPDESGELANTRLCVAGSNEIGSDLFDVGLDCARLGLPPSRTCPFLEPGNRWPGDILHWPRWLTWSGLWRSRSTMTMVDAVELANTRVCVAGIQENCGLFL